MAVAVKPSNSLINIRSSIKSVRSSFSGLKKKTGNLNNILLRKTKVKRETIARNYILSQRRQEAERRKNREDLIEASSIGGVFKRQAKAVASSTKGFLGRIMDFLGTLLVGWLMYNLPSIITMAQELIARMQRLSTIVSGFFNNTVSIFRGFGNLLGAVGTNILTFDFTDSHNRVKNAMTDLGSTFDDMQNQFDEGFKLLTTSLGEGIVSGEDAQPFGTKYENESIPSGPIGGIHKKALNIIAGPESGGNYNAMNQGTDGSGRIIGSGDSHKVIGKALTSMTIGEVMDRQNERKYPRNASPDLGIHAAGKYQMIGNTLPGAMKSAGLKPSDAFNAENQDRMALALMQSRGLSPWTSGGSRYSAKDRAIIEQARRTPLSIPSPAEVSSSPSQTPPFQPGTGGKVIQYITGDRTSPRYSADHGGKNYHDHIGFDSQSTRDSAIKFLMSKGWTIGSVNTGKHAYGSLHYKNLAFDIPFYPNQSRKGVPDNSKGETSLSSRLRSDLIAGGFVGPQLKGGGINVPTSEPSQIASQGTQQRQQVSQQLAQQRNGPTIVVIEEDPPAQQQVSAGGGGGGGMIPIIINPLNSFITQKLLLDLAYT
jgi:hypothetical protein